MNLVAPLTPDVTIFHAPVADEHGNVVLSVPNLDGVMSAWAARRGAVVTVERIVADVRPLQHLAQLPAHRVLAVVEAPLGAHPGPLYAGQLPVEGYVDDIPFWNAARAATRGDLRRFAKQWCLDVGDHAEYLRRLGRERVDGLMHEAARPRPITEQIPPSGIEVTPTPAETAATLAARELVERIACIDADVVLAGLGVANLAAWVGVDAARARGSDVRLVAEVGMFGYDPEPGNPLLFNPRNFATCTMLGDCSVILGTVIAGPGTRAIGCVGAAQVDRAGNVNSTEIPDGPFLVGSGGVNDVLTAADESLVVAMLRPARTPAQVGYVTAPGGRVVAVATDHGLLRKVGGELKLTSVVAGPEPLDVRVRRVRELCGWELEVAPGLVEVPAPTPDEVAALRRYDPQRWYLSADS